MKRYVLFIFVSSILILITNGCAYRSVGELGQGGAYSVTVIKLKGIHFKAEMDIRRIPQDWDETLESSRSVLADTSETVIFPYSISNMNFLVIPGSRPNLQLYKIFVSVDGGKTFEISPRWKRERLVWMFRIANGHDGATHYITITQTYKDPPLPYQGSYDSNQNRYVEINTFKIYYCKSKGDKWLLQAVNNW